MLLPFSERVDDSKSAIDRASEIAKPGLALHAFFLHDVLQSSDHDTIKDLARDVEETYSSPVFTQSEISFLRQKLASRDKPFINNHSIFVFVIVEG